MDTSEIVKLKDQFASGQWPQFLEMVKITGLRGFNGEAVNFNFPVVTIVGENGSGKSTLMKAIACGYDKDAKVRHYYPSKLFLDTQWDNFENVEIEYRVKRGSNVDSFRVSKGKKRWNFPEKKFIRSIFIFDISRTLPLDATAGYAKIAKQAASEASTAALDADNLKWLSYILGKAYKQARFATTDINAEKQVGLLEYPFGEISQFHQGAGEDATLDLFMALQSIPENSLLLIDEVEASLHPRAQRRLIKYLLWLSRKKRLQLILSTHSPYIFDELPREARILLIPSHTGLNVVYGASSEFAMSRLDDETQPALHLFVEDYETAQLLREIILGSPDAETILPQISINVVGPANVVSFLGRLSSEAKLPYKALGVLDGDQNASPGCIVLPGGDAPEKMVFAGLKALKWNNLDHRFGIGAGTLFDHFNDAMLSPDHHEWCGIIGDKIKQGRKQVWDIFANEWCKQALQADQRKIILDAIKDRLS